MADPGVIVNTPDWHEIKSGGFVVPERESFDELTALLFTQIGSTDPDLREITYDILSEWILNGMYSHVELVPMIGRLAQNLRFGLGEVESDSVFLRSFSALLVGEIANYDNDAEVLDVDSIQSIMTALLSLVRGEVDRRGFVEGKGWAHAIEHARMALGDVVRSRLLVEEDRAKIAATLATVTE